MIIKYTNYCVYFFFSLLFGIAYAITNSVIYLLS